MLAPMFRGEEAVENQKNKTGSLSLTTATGEGGVVVYRVIIKVLGFVQILVYPCPEAALNHMQKRGRDEGRGLRSTP